MLTKSIIMLPVENIVRKLDIALGDDCRKHHCVFNPPVMLTLKNVAVHCK